MEDIIQKIIDLKDNVQSGLIKCGFDIDKEIAEYSIKMTLQETQVILRSTFLAFNRRSFVLSSFFTPEEISLIELTLKNIEGLYQQSENILAEEEYDPIWKLGELQTTSILSYPNPTSNVREKQVRPFVDLPIIDVPDQLDILKPLFRPFAYRGSEARGDTYKKLNENLLVVEKLQSDFISNLDKSEVNKNLVIAMRESAEDVLGEINKLKEEVKKNKKELEDEVAAVVLEIEKVQEKAEEWETRILEMHTNETKVSMAAAKAEEEAKEAELSKKQLDRLLKIAEENNDEATNAKEFLDSKLSEAEKLITQAKAVLNLSGTVSLGKFYDDQYIASKSSVKGWLISCGVLLSVAVIVCMWALLGYGSNREALYLISRVSVVPLLLGGLWFCATQYIKQKHIIEDYAYKRVLALSMVSFRNEIKDSSPSGVDAFVSAVLQELHKPPLDSLERKNLNEEVKLLKGVQTEMLKEMLDAMKSNMKDKVSSENEKQST